MPQIQFIFSRYLIPPRKKFELMSFAQYPHKTLSCISIEIERQFIMKQHNFKIKKITFYPVNL